MNKPLISVIMGIYNCADTLEEAVQSIIDQTITDWELIMCDDGSTDHTYETAKALQQAHPDKIILLKQESNRGLSAMLNRCLEAAQGTYIARMDGDDYCRSDRFASELQVLQDHPEIDIVSSDMEFFDESGVWGLISHPTNPVEQDFMKESPFCHAPCMVRKSAYDKVDGYSEDKQYHRVEDYHLWIKMYATGCKGMNIHEPLYQMRDDRNAYGRRKFRYRINEARVKHLARKTFHLPISYEIYVVKPILIGLLPGFLYDFLHRKRLGA